MPILVVHVGDGSKGGPMRQYYKIMPEEMCHSLILLQHINLCHPEANYSGFLEVIALVCIFLRGWRRDMME